MTYIRIAPNYGLEVDLRVELADATDIPQDIDQFWKALSILWYQPSNDLGGVAGVYVPTEFQNVPPPVAEYWWALRPLFLQILAEHPTLMGKREGPNQPPSNLALLSQFGASMLKSDPETGQPTLATI